jgi:hypothetical protein
VIRRATPVLTVIVKVHFDEFLDSPAVLNFEPRGIYNSWFELTNSLVFLDPGIEFGSFGESNLVAQLWLSWIIEDI